MEPTYPAEIVRFWATMGLLVGWVGGYFWTVFITRKALLKMFKAYTDELHSQYVYLLNKFDIYKKPNGEWQSHANETITSGREIKAYKRSSDTKD